MLNKVMLVGRINRIEFKTAENGTSVATFSMATNRTWKDKSSGEKREYTQWHRVAVFGRTAEICGEYLAKGSLVFVEGRLQTSTYEKEGEKRYCTEVVADRVLCWTENRRPAATPPRPKKTMRNSIFRETITKTGKPATG